MTAEPAEQTETPRIRNTEGLVPWVKGQSGNPKGRPRKGDTYLDYLEAKVSRRAKRLADAVVNKAERGDIRAHVYIRDTLFGIPKQTLEVQQADSPYTLLMAALVGSEGRNGLSTSLPEPRNTGTEGSSDTIEGSYTVSEDQSSLSSNISGYAGTPIDVSDGPSTQA